MTIIKRNGTEVIFDSQKIVDAITKANESVGDVFSRMSPAQIRDIAGYVAKTCNEANRPLSVEEIQDLVEHEIMARGAFDVAKNYITYRYARALVRKANTTDESILSLIRNDNKELAEENSNKNTVIASTQRDYIAGEVSRDLTRRILLPERISKAHDEGVLHFHDADYFVQPS